MTGKFSRVPRDLRRRLADLAVAADDYDDLDGVRALPGRATLPGCPVCDARLQPSGVFLSGGGVAVAVRLRCRNASEHDSGMDHVYVYEISTRQLYPKDRRPGDATEITLTAAQYRRDLERVAEGESVGAVLLDRVAATDGCE